MIFLSWQEKKAFRTIDLKLHVYGKVGLIRTSGILGHTFANSGNPDEMAPYEPSHQDFHYLLS